MIIPAVTILNNFGNLYSVVNTMISLWNANDVDDLTTVDKTSLKDAINEVNGKTIPFYLKDSSTKSNIELEV